MCYNEGMTINWNRRTYTESEFTEAYNSSVSIAEVARKLGLTIYGSTYKTIKDTARELGLSGDHFLGRGWNIGGKVQPSKPKPLEEYLVDGSRISSSHLKKRLFSAGLKEKQCEICGISEWLDKPAPLALDHINGINNDNRLENLRILCYNCHGQTETFCRGQVLEKTSKTKVKLERQPKEYRPAIPESDIDILVEQIKSFGFQGASEKTGMTKNTIRKYLKHYGRYEEVARGLSGKNQEQKIDWPSVDEIVIGLRESNYSVYSKKIGVSDNAIRKHLKREGYDPKTLEKQPDD